jgi:hypothetical protein
MEGLNFFIPMSVAVKLATNYEKNSRRGTATIWKDFIQIALNKLL